MIVNFQVPDEEGGGERLQAVRGDKAGERGQPEPVQEARLPQALHDRAHDLRAVLVARVGADGAPRLRGGGEHDTAGQPRERGQAAEHRAVGRRRAAGRRRRRGRGEARRRGRGGGGGQRGRVHAGRGDARVHRRTARGGEQVRHRPDDERLRRADGRRRLLRGRRHVDVRRWRNERLPGRRWRRRWRRRRLGRALERKKRPRELLTLRKELRLEVCVCVNFDPDQRG